MIRPTFGAFDALNSSLAAAWKADTHWVVSSPIPEPTAPKGQMAERYIREGSRSSARPASDPFVSEEAGGGHGVPSSVSEARSCI